jgi:hypothetical protein
MRLDRKFLLILPSIVLVLVAGGIFYTATRLRLIVAGSDDIARRTAYITAVEKGTKTITTPQAVELIDISLQAEAKSKAAVDAAHDLVMFLAWITVGCCVLLFWGISGVPRVAIPGQSRGSPILENPEG